MTTAPSNLTQQPAQHQQGHAGDAPRSPVPIPPGLQSVGYLFGLLDSRTGNLVFGVLIAAMAWYFAIGPEIQASREAVARELETIKTVNTKIDLLTVRLDAMVMSLDRIARNGAKQ